MRIENELYPIHTALSALAVFERHNEIVSKYGLELFLKKQEFKRAREMYQTAVYAIGRTAKTGDYYWVTPSSDNTPDCYIIWKKGTELFVECVEIALWNQHVEDMWEIIEKKINKQYPHYFSIVINDDHEDANVSSEYYRKLHERLKTCSIIAGAVRFWMPIKNKGERDVLIGELYPTDNWTEFSSEHILKTMVRSMV
jgi:hypothetical protein